MHGYLVPGFWLSDEGVPITAPLDALQTLPVQAQRTTGPGQRATAHDGFIAHDPLHSSPPNSTLIKYAQRFLGRSMVEQSNPWIHGQDVEVVMWASTEFQHFY